MNQIDAKFIIRVIKNNLNEAIELLKRGANVHVWNDEALRWSVENNNLSMLAILLENGADVRACDDEALRMSIEAKNWSMVSALLENGANLHCKNELVLAKLKDEFDEELANIILPYCSSDDYAYFPSEYIHRNIVCTKSANSAQKN